MGNFSTFGLSASSAATRARDTSTWRMINSTIFWSDPLFFPRIIILCPPRYSFGRYYVVDYYQLDVV